MAKVKSENGIQENSLDSSGEGEYMDMVEEDNFGTVSDKDQISQVFMDSNEENSGSSYQYRDLSGNVTYELVHMTSPEEANVAASPSPTLGLNEYYVVSGKSVEVFGTHAPSNKKVAIRREPLRTKTVTAKKRDDKRRATHNEVERRRRDKINHWITKLAALVPNSGLPDSTSKGGILEKACDYITDLAQKQKRLEKLEIDHEKLVLEILRLNQEMSEVRKDNASLRNQVADTKMAPQIDTAPSRVKREKS